MREGEVQLTCKQARISPQRMSHDSGNTAEGNLKMTQKKLTIKILQKYSRHPFLKHVAAQNMKSVNYVAGGKRCTVEHHLLTSAESVSMYINPL